MEVAPKDGTTVVLPDVPAGSAYWLDGGSTGSLAEHPDVVAAFETGARSVLVVGPDFEAAKAREPAKVISYMDPEQWGDFLGSKADA